MIGAKCNDCKTGIFTFPDCKGKIGVFENISIESLFKKTYISKILVCGCNINGSISASCDPDGQCDCKSNIIGIKCTHCETGYHGFPDCKSKLRINLIGILAKKY